MAGTGKLEMRVMVEMAQPRISWHTDYEKTEGGSERIPAPVWPEGWPIPRVGDEVSREDGSSLKVTAVVWYPSGEDGSDPFVYVVLH